MLTKIHDRLEVIAIFGFALLSGVVFAWLTLR